MNEEKINLKTYKQMFKAFSTALYYDQDRKRYHGVGTALIGKKLAKMTGLAEPSRLFYTGLIHDLGGVGLDHHIVHIALADQEERKKFSTYELNQVRSHGPLGAEKLAEYEGFSWAIPLVRNHHERYDGTGIPAGKRGDEVSLATEILGAADMLDLYLCSKERTQDSNRERLEDFKDFLKNHGGFRGGIRDGIIEIVSQEKFIRSLKSIAYMEEMLDECIEQLTPPGGVHLEGIVELLGSVIDIKSNYTEDHSHRVATLGEEVGSRLGMSPKELTEYRYAAYLHDLGKVGIDRSIITKPASLTKKEYDEIKKHPTYSKEILSQIEKLEEVARIAGQHHERYDGTGYPNELKGNEITLSARIISVVDAWDAMTTERPYRKAMNEEKAIEELRNKAGNQFDPKVVKEFLSVITTTPTQTSAKFSPN